MALILAINPGNSHSPTLARLARELKGYELIGAESCAIAMTAMKERVPALVLLPDRTPRGEAELLLKLRTIPGGVPTLRLPSVAAADPAALAKEIRAMLEAVKSVPAPAPPKATIPAKSKGTAGQTAKNRQTGGSKPAPVARHTPRDTPAGPSPHVLAAAKAAVNWVHAQRAQWAEIDALARQPIIVAAGRAASPYETAGVRTHDDELTSRIDQTDEWRPTNELEETDATPARSPVATWLPRAAVVAVLIGAGWAGMTLRTPSGEPAADAGAQLETASEPQSEPLKTSVLPPIAVPPEGSPAVSGTAEPVSGWVTVSAPFDVSVTNANEPVALDDRGRGMLPPGKYRLRFQNVEVGYDETRAVEVRPTGTTTIDLAPQTTISVSANEPADVLIDGRSVGQTPYEGRLSFGPHSVTVRTAGGEREIKLSATMKPVQLEVDFTQPQP